jgi:AcrR family transcriptional regulator
VDDRRVAGHTHGDGSPANSVLLARRRTRTHAASGRSGPGQRDRVLGAVSELTARDGYTEVTVGAVISHAGVSRPTFYEHFSGREDCLLAALAPLYARLLAEVLEAVDGASPAGAAGAAASALVSFAQREPAMARLALGEPLAAGSRCLCARDDFVASLAHRIEAAYARAPRDAPAADLSGRVLVGAISRMLASRLAREEPITDAFSRELLAWVEAYELPLERHRWRALQAVAKPRRSQYPPAAALRAPAPSAENGRRVHNAAALAEQRMRIIFATAELVSRVGYEAATVTAISREAGLDTRAFYRCFSEKAQALRAAGELLFGHLMAVAAGAFVVGETWPERVWEAASALAECAQQNETLARVWLLHGQAAGPATADRLQEIARAFTVFLEEGLRDEATSTPPDVTLEAISTSVFEIGYQLARSGDGQELPGLVPHLVFIALAPFLGASKTSRFVAERCAEPAA